MVKETHTGLDWIILFHLLARQFKLSLWRIMKSSGRKDRCVGKRNWTGTWTRNQEAQDSQSICSWDLLTTSQDKSVFPLTYWLIKVWKQLLRAPGRLKALMCVCVYLYIHKVSWITWGYMGQMLHLAQSSFSNGDQEYASRKKHIKPKQASCSCHTFRFPRLNRKDFYS